MDDIYEKKRNKMKWIETNLLRKTDENKKQDFIIGDIQIGVERKRLFKNSIIIFEMKRK